MLGVAGPWLPQLCRAEGSLRHRGLRLPSPAEGVLADVVGSAAAKPSAEIDEELRSSSR